MAVLVVLAVIALAFGILFGGILAISWGIRREDKHGGRWDHRDTPTFA